MPSACVSTVAEHADFLLTPGGTQAFVRRYLLNEYTHSGQSLPSFPQAIAPPQHRRKVESQIEGIEIGGVGRA